MLKKLRTKFILINMTIVTIMLGVIFGLLYYSTSRSLERESVQMLERIAMSPVQIKRPDAPPNEVILPYFSILIGRDGTIVLNSGDFFDLSDSALVDQLIESARESAKPVGTLKEYRLRYFYRENPPMGEYIVFADMTSEQSTLRNLIKTFVLIGSAAYIVFFGISVLLARWAVRPVDSAWKQQKQFVADASHELKTPLTVIMTNAELLTSPGCSAEERKQLSDNIVVMAGQMRGLVESLLDLARLDNGSRKVQMTPVSFSDAVSEAAMIFEPVFFEKGMLFSYEVEPDIQVRGNGTQLKQLAEILLDNAAKYASPGGETVLRLQRSSHRRCLLEVSDQGEAICEEDLKNLFKRFYRADKSRAMNHSYGLGLSIAQSICQEHQGQISVKSAEGWNTFSVELPAEK